MNRRSLDVEGCVKFPTHLPSSGEGGMLVKLWVIDRQDFEKAYGVCAGVNVADVVTESFLGTDRSQPPKDDLYENYQEYSDVEFLAKDRAYREAHKTWQESFYDYESGNVGGLLASVVLGSTGWSNSEFLCTYEDLSAEGKVLYDCLTKLYPNAELHLATFLDT